MHTTDISAWKHEHDFSGDSSSAERRTRWVIGLTVSMMVVEILAGYYYNSMALLADGWHMSTHAIAFLLTAVAYSIGRRHAKNVRFTFGTGKVGVLSGFASAIILAVIALLMGAQSIHRLFDPQSIHFREAFLIAGIGLAVNLVCALLLKNEPHHHSHSHGPSEGGHHHDMNLRAAYLHVLADALTSILAIAALLGGYFLGWVWLDALMGLVGMAVILSWSYGLMRDTGSILLDKIPSNTDLPEVIREGIETDGDAVIVDLHIWQVGVNKFAAIVGIVAHNPKTPDEYRQALAIHQELVHVTIEVQVCNAHSIEREHTDLALT